MEQTPAVLRISDPADLAQIVPYLVGFIPEDSLVVIATQNRRIQVTARIDLTDVQPPGAAENLLDRIRARFPDAEAYTIAYTHDPEAAWPILNRCDAHLPDGCQTLVIDGDHWQLSDGTRGTIDPYGQVAATATFHGLQRLATRAELEARFASPPDSPALDQQAAAALAELPDPDQTDRILALTAGLIDQDLPGPDSPPLPVQDAVQLSVLAQHPAARDLALASIDRDNAEAHLQLWQDVIRHSPAYGADMALYLAGMAAWISGDGASANIALERSLNAEPAAAAPHPARLLEGIIDNVVPPTAWPRLRQDILDHAHPAVKQALDHTRTPIDPTPTKGWPPAAPAATPQRPEQTRRTPPAPGIAI